MVQSQLTSLESSLADQDALQSLEQALNQSDVSLETLMDSQDTSLEASDSSLEARLEGSVINLETEISAQAEQISALETLTAVFGSRLNPASSCQAIKRNVANAADGNYFLSINNQVVQVYCLMSKADGGWTHVYTTAGSILATFRDTSFKTLCMNTSKPCYGGSSVIVPTVLPQATEWLLTDESFTPFMLQEFRIVGNYERSLRQSCSPYNRYQARYPKGALATLGWVPLEACVSYDTGMRNVFGSAYGRCTAVHICWMDTRPALSDRPFAHDHCGAKSGRPFCPAYDPAYTYPTTAGRNGTMNFHAFLRFQEPQLGSTASFPGKSCEAIKATHNTSKNGHYYIRPKGTSVFKVFCLMDVEDGGWTLVLNTVGTGRERLNQATRKELCWHPGQACHSGVSSAVPDVMPTAKAMLWTDNQFKPFLFAEFKTPGQYWTGITTRICNSNALSVEVRYPKGPLAKLGWINIESCTQYLWGTRNQLGTQLGECSSIHICWTHVDSSVNDQPFFGACTYGNNAYCPGYSPEYNFPSTAGRHGNFDHSMFVRF